MRRWSDRRLIGDLQTREKEPVDPDDAWNLGIIVISPELLGAKDPDADRGWPALSK